jgi:uncharacterized Zn finger protein (UPF0148 family)
MPNPFKKITKKSKETQKVWDNIKQAPTVDTKKCKGCGAARPKDTNLTTCAYCGYRFMTVNTTVKKDI